MPLDNVAQIDVLAGDSVTFSRRISITAGGPGPEGPQGDPGTPGSKIYSGTSAPGSGVGVAGDYYINTTTGDFYGPKTTAWGSSVLSIKGTAGTSGANGKTILSGSVAPSAGTGTDGDFYINLSTKQLYGPKASGSWGSGISLNGNAGSDGSDGWTPVFAVVSDGSRRVLQVNDWTGGEGTKPTTGQYVGATGLTGTLASAVDIRGASGTGSPGADGNDGWSPVLSVVTDGARRVHQVTDWVGGEGTKPATGSYIGASGLTAVLANAVDIRGAAGGTGSNGDTGWSPVLAVVTDGARRVLQVSEWTGGTGTKPTIGQYVGATGLTGTLASAVDIRGAAGADGAGATIAAGTGISVSTTGGTTTISLNADEIIRDVVGSSLVAGSNIGIVVDDAGNTITFSSSATGGTSYEVTILPVDSTGSIAMDSNIQSAITTINNLNSNGRYTVKLRFGLGNFLITNPATFDDLCIQSSAMRGLTVCGPDDFGKRGTLLIFSSSATSGTNQSRAALFRLVNQRQFVFRDIGFKSTNSNQTLFYLFCSVGDDGIYPEFPVNTAQNSGRFERIWVEGSWEVLWGADGGTRANLNSEMAFTNWTVSNDLTVSGALFRWGYPLRNAVYLSTGISAPTAGSFTLTYNGQTTGSLNYNASASSIQTALEGLSTIGAGNVVVAASSTPTAGSYIVRFVNAMAGVVNTNLFSTNTTGWSGVSWKVFRYPPQQAQFLNYSFRDNEFEYASGTFCEINRGGSITFSGYHSVIVGTSGGSGGTLFYMPEIATHADDACTLVVGPGFRPELRTATSKIIDCSWHGVNKSVSFTDMKVSVTAISGGSTGSAVKGMESIAFRNAIDAQQAIVKFTRCEIPGYVTFSQSSGANGPAYMFEQCRFESWTTVTSQLFASQSALAADTAVAIRVLGSAKILATQTFGNGGAMVTDGTTLSV